MSHTHMHGCTHCGCHNPVLDVFHKNSQEDEIKELIKEGIPYIEKKDHPVAALLYKGGIIRPMVDGDAKSVEAIAFYGDIVVASGEYDYVKKALKAYIKGNIKEDTKTGVLIQEKELTGTQTLLPGFIEPHAHVIASSITSGRLWCDLTAFENQRIKENYNFDYIKDEIKKHETKLENKDFWILGQGVDPALMPFVKKECKNELLDINIERIDSLGYTRPVFLLSASMHTAYVNELTLEQTYKNYFCKLGGDNPYKSYEEYRKTINGALQEEVQYLPALLSLPKEQKKLSY